MVFNISAINFASEIDAPIPKKVLIIHSNEEFIPANLHMNPELFSVLKNNEEFSITLYSEYLDVARLHNETIETLYAAIFNERYETINPDVIIAIDFKAFIFLKEKAPSFYNSTPIVLCMLPEGLIDEKNLPPNITGNYLNIDAIGSANIIMDMHPDTTEIVIVSGSGAADKSKLIEIRKSLKSFDYDTSISILAEMPFDDTLEAISKLPGSSVILYNAIFQDLNGEVWIPSEALIEMNKHTSVPIYGLYFTNLVNGLVGGSLFEFKEVANDAALKTIQILEGRNPSDLKMSKVINKSYFNWALLKQWDIDEKNIPENSTLLYKNFTTWELYKYQIIGVILFIILETGLIFLLMMQLNLRRAAEKKLIIFNTELEYLVEERTKTIHSINQTLEIKNEDLIEEIKVRQAIEKELIDNVTRLNTTQNRLVLAENLAKTPSLIAICYPNKKIILQKTSFRKIISSLANFSIYQRSQHPDLEAAELIFDLEDDTLRLTYKDKALEQISEISKTFDPFSYNSFKSNESGLELVVLYNSVTIGMNGTITLIEHINGDYKRTIEINIPINQNDITCS